MATGRHALLCPYGGSDRCSVSWLASGAQLPMKAMRAYGRCSWTGRATISTSREATYGLGRLDPDTRDFGGKIGATSAEGCNTPSPATRATGAAGLPAEAALRHLRVGTLTHLYILQRRYRDAEPRVAAVGDPRSPE